ncbi:MAG: dCTP deaminase [Crenarchaeota archaeon]|nr:dCTP deaminase [Thermoproteota archaeon]
MILADRDIEWYLARGLLRIEPLHEDTIRENGVDLRLGREFCRFRSGAPPLDTAKPFDPEAYYQCTTLNGNGGFRVEPYEHVLATTLETVCLPDDLVGLVNVRSTYARLGIYIPPTVIDAGFCGQVTIEIIGSAYPVILHPGTRFLHVVFARTTTPVARPYRGKYQGQTGVTPPRPDP